MDFVIWKYFTVYSVVVVARPESKDAALLPSNIMIGSFVALGAVVHSEAFDHA